MTMISKLTTEDRATYEGYLTEGIARANWYEDQAVKHPKDAVQHLLDAASSYYHAENLALMLQEDNLFAEDMYSYYMKLACSWEARAMSWANYYDDPTHAAECMANANDYYARAKEATSK
jgi:hypothetical protein